jgi:hypothetical protein
MTLVTATVAYRQANARVLNMFGDCLRGWTAGLRCPARVFPFATAPKPASGSQSAEFPLTEGHSGLKATGS